MAEALGWVTLTLGPVWEGMGKLGWVTGALGWVGGRQWEQPGVPSPPGPPWGVPPRLPPQVAAAEESGRRRATPSNFGLGTAEMQPGASQARPDRGDRDRAWPGGGVARALGGGMSLAAWRGSQGLGGTWEDPRHHCPRQFGGTQGIMGGSQGRGGCPWQLGGGVPGHHGGVPGSLGGGSQGLGETQIAMGGGPWQPGGRPTALWQLGGGGSLLATWGGPLAAGGGSGPPVPPPRPPLPPL